MAEKQITDMPTRAAPNSRTTKDSERFALVVVKASFDGSAAATAFVPTVQVVSDSGRIVGTFEADEQVAAGGSADATFAPFLRNRRGDIRFVRNNVGGWLVVHTDATAPVPPAFSGGAGIEFVATNAGVYFEGTFVFYTSSGDSEVDAGRDFNVNTGRDEQHIVTRFVQFNAESFFVDVTDDVAINPNRLAFFGATPVTRQATPATLPQVIALLQAYGLCP